MIYIVKHKSYKNKVPNGYAELYVGSLLQTFNQPKPESKVGDSTACNGREPMVCNPPKANAPTVENLKTPIPPTARPMTDCEMEPSINNLNPYLNEATALYDIWKNKEDYVVGMCHYRRFLKLGNGILPFDKAAEMISDGGRIIVSREEGNGCSCHDYCRREYGRDVFDKYFKMMYVLNPEAAKWFRTATRFFSKEMFVCRKKDMDRFCVPLFKMIIPMAERFEKEDGNKHGVNRRIIGYMTERLFGYFVSQSGLKVERLNWMWV